MTIQERIKDVIRTIPDFPKKGIFFKDITPIFLDPKLCEEITLNLADQFKGSVDVVAGIESRGLMFGMMLAHYLKVPFVPIRKKGKLPGDTVSQIYDLEYGSAEIEIHSGQIKTGSRVLIHDDLLATGGTAEASAELVKRLNCQITGFAFLINLTFLDGISKIDKYDAKIYSLLDY